MVKEVVHLRKLFKRLVSGVLILIIIFGLGIIGFRIYFAVKARIDNKDIKGLVKEILDDSGDSESESDEKEEVGGEEKSTTSETERKPVGPGLDTSEKAIETCKELISELRKKYGNEDVVGYLKLDGHNIEYPIMYGDSNDSYIKTSPYGSYDYNGSIFLDWGNQPDFSDTRSVVYGHNMRDGTMFGMLRLIYQDNIDNEIFTIYTERGILRYKIFCCNLISGSGTNWYVHPTVELQKNVGKDIEAELESEAEERLIEKGYDLNNFEDWSLVEEMIQAEKNKRVKKIDMIEYLKDKDMSKFLTNLKKNPVIYNESIKTGVGDTYVTLMTCYTGGVERFAVTGKLLDEYGE